MNSNERFEAYQVLNPKKLPSHIAIIMDGNGRWAKKRKLSRINGHKKAPEAVRSVLKTCRELEIPFLTLYTFSTENWERPKKEVSALMSLLKRFLISERKELADNNIRLAAIGQIERLPEEVCEELENTIKVTQNNTGMVLTLALSYGGRAEITKAVSDIVSDVLNNKLNPSMITPDLVSQYLYTKEMPDPDLVIRTGGEMRISNLFLWQIAYSEIYVTDTLWPDFSKEELIEILANYQRRQRRFGKILP